MLTMRYKCRRDKNESGWIMLFSIINCNGEYLEMPYIMPVSGKNEGISILKSILQGEMPDYFKPEKYAFTRLFNIDDDNIQEINWIGEVKNG